MGVDSQQGALLTVISADGLQVTLQALRRRGFRTVGPTLRDQAIVYDDIESVDDLPRGWTDEQDGGHYRLARRADGALFGYAVGPHSWKQFLHPPRLRLWQAEQVPGSMRLVSEDPSCERFAFIGVRACELHAIAIQDRVFLDGPYRDPHYQGRRAGAFIVAVNCGKAGGTCFCVSMNTGPRAEKGFDLALTELVGEDRHDFLVEAGSDDGRRLCRGS